MRLFADDANLFFKHEDINILESEINHERDKFHTWLTSNKPSQDIGKSSSQSIFWLAVEDQLLSPRAFKCVFERTQKYLTLQFDFRPFKPP